MKEMLRKIKELVNSVIGGCYINEIATFIIGWIIVFDTIGGTMIPIAYGKGTAWFAIPNLIIDLYVIRVFIKRIKHDSAA